MSVQRRLKPGDPGSKKYLEKYGERLISIRYRVDEAANERITTVELIEDRRPIKEKEEPPHNKNVFIKINYDEYALREKVKSAGAVWNAEKKIWELNYRRVKELNLTSRITDK